MSPAHSQGLKKSLNFPAFGTQKSTRFTSQQKLMFLGPHDIRALGREGYQQENQTSPYRKVWERSNKPCLPLRGLQEGVTNFPLISRGCLPKLWG